MPRRIKRTSWQKAVKFPKATIRNVNPECMFRCTLLTSGYGQKVNAIGHIELSPQSSEAEIKKDGR